MNRRALLVATGTGLSIAIAGCTSDEEPNDDDGTAGDSTEGQTSNSEPEPVDDQNASGEPGQHAAAVGPLEVTYRRATSADNLRYFDDEADDIEFLEPEHDRWVLSLIEAHNLRDSPVSAPDPDEFAIEVDGERFAVSSEMPVRGHGWDALRLESEQRHRWFDAGVPEYRQSLDPGEAADIRLLVDAPDGEDTLVWEPEDVEFDPQETE